MLTSIVPTTAPVWAANPFLRWRLADEAAERTGEHDAIRAWHVCADLPPHMSRGRWMDGAEAMVREILPNTAVAEIVGHLPPDHPPHVHILVAARAPTDRRYGPPLLHIESLLRNDLQARWLQWLRSDGAVGDREQFNRGLSLAA